jgi:hypothetical protein
MERPAGHLEDQLGAAAAGPFGRDRIERALEPKAGGAGKPQGARGAPHRHCIELGGFDQHVGRVEADLGLGPSHDTSKPDWPGGVRDHQHLRAKLVHSVIDCREPLAGNPPAHHQPVFFQAVQVVSVQGLATLEHDVVGHIDDIADRPDADRLQSLPHPPRALADAHARNDPGGEPRTQIAGHNRDARAFFHRLAGFGWPRIGAPELLMK